ncbi:MAG TPA: polysaccharide deacetylase family protein [Bacillota bacterium]|jgi:peptidoglycan/xylan/chitin deacetylase (PgdA/CDA1 family)|nr:polysaccharide deacetylase family protein [Peptococcaceae bacterium MAG4]NLW39183.1 polysaccharide deacetylase family protein [Peptococcaceae bacterium]HPU36281.1 polysaccharide deacetylase family protein [Bacillota bacterium]HPZ43626.1 polysaccharide deacetylase family protein [Bacillota bacterium]HQD75749.1 polysaccharide deacetylase family protein [Bacillota bacterium]
MRVYYINTSKMIRLILTASLFGLTALFLTAALLMPGGGPNTGSGVICRVKTDEKIAALTFNISWGSRVPGPVLDVLKKENVQATFFIGGTWAKNYPELARRIVHEGHEIGGGWEGLVGFGVRADTAFKDLLAKSRNDIQEVTGVSPALFRITGGNWDAALQAVAKEDYRLIQWSLDSLDIQTPGPNQIVNNVLNGIQPGSIILLNASDTASQTPQALPAVIEKLRKEGYKLVTVSSLLELGPGLAD